MSFNLDPATFNQADTFWSNLVKNVIATGSTQVKAQGGLFVRVSPLQSEVDCSYIGGNLPKYLMSDPSGVCKSQESDVAASYATSFFSTPPGKAYRTLFYGTFSFWVSYALTANSTLSLYRWRELDTNNSFPQWRLFYQGQNVAGVFSTVADYLPDNGGVTFVTNGGITVLKFSYTGLWNFFGMQDSAASNTTTMRCYFDGARIEF